jgi:ABC-type polysaccharide/polyol phosphate transport system ATPase subunit
MSTKTVLEVTNVSKRFARGLRQAMRYAMHDTFRQLFRPGNPEDDALRPGEFWAVRNVSFTLKRGEAVGIMGNNGAGKSTLLRLITGIYKPTTGQVQVDGKIGAIVELGTAFAPFLTGRENIRPQAMMHGYTGALLRRQLDRIIEFADIGEFIDSPVAHYSTGMRARLGFAVAAMGQPELLVVDEVLAVGDLTFQNKCLHFVEEFRKRGGSVLFVGHNPVQMQAACDRGIILEHGRVTFEGTIVDAIDRLFNSAETGSAKAQNASVGANQLDQNAIASNGSPNHGRVQVLATKVSYEQADTSTDNDTLVVEATLTTDGGRQGLQLGFVLFSSLSVNAVAFSFTEPLTLPAGTHQITVQVPSLHLVPGDYLVKMSLSAGSPPYPIWTQGWHDVPRSLRVPGDPSAVNNLARMISARIRLDNQVSMREISAVNHESQAANR